MAVADAGFASRKNGLAATELGVKQVVLPGASKRSKEKERKRWFRRALRWRTGCEGRISALKRRHGLRRCRDRGTAGVERWGGPGGIANNLLVLRPAAPRWARSRPGTGKHPKQQQAGGGARPPPRARRPPFAPQ